MAVRRRADGGGRAVQVAAYVEMIGRNLSAPSVLRNSRPLSRVATIMAAGREPRLSMQTMRVLDALLGARAEELSGADIRRATGLASGTLYPILLRLEEAGWLQSQWEGIDPAETGRPRRRFYRLTAIGERRVRAAFGQFGSRVGGLAWS